jgi:hypothetical protein
MNLTLTNYENEEEARSGFYTRDIQNDEQDETTPRYYENGKRRRRWFSFKKRNQGMQRGYSDYRHHQQDQHLLGNSQPTIEMGKGQGKMFDGKDQAKSEENLFIESFVKECMRESMRNHNNKSKERLDSTQQYDSTEENTYKNTERESNASASFINSRERKPIARSVTLQNSHVSGNRAQRNENTEDRRETIPREARRVNSDAQVDAERRKNRRPHSHYVDSRDIADITERQKRASERISTYYERPTTANGNVSSDEYKNNNKRNGNLRKHSRHDKDCDNDSEHGSTLSAFALVPGTDLQRKLSQRGISDKASIDIIKQTKTTSKQRADRKYPPPSSSARNSKYGSNRRSFHSVDNIYASSSSSAVHSANKHQRHSSHMTPNLHSSFSADNIDNQNHLFKPLKNPTGNAPPPMFMVTSTPREVEAVPEEQEEESYATYV